MTINGMRLPPGVPPFLPPAAQGDADAEKVRAAAPAPGAAAGDPAQSELAERSPPRTREGAIPPRAALAMLASVQAAAGGTPATPQAIAAKVRGQVTAGKVKLRGAHADAILRAALLAAARGLTVLSKESLHPTGE
ncbi:hypothetical protein [Ideonella sp. YS5]|uniref:hypothetical protein n=1 Tax=Ideonella sp. YS5 TaxID=3453714 RepID=UPI003EEC4B92